MAERYYRCSCVRATIFIRVLRVYASAEVGAAFTDLLRAGIPVAVIVVRIPFG